MTPRDPFQSVILLPGSAFLFRPSVKCSLCVMGTPLLPQFLLVVWPVESRGRKEQSASFLLSGQTYQGSRPDCPWPILGPLHPGQRRQLALVSTCPSLRLRKENLFFQRLLSAGLASVLP